MLYVGLVFALLIATALFFLSLKSGEAQDYPINSLRLESNAVYLDIQNDWTQAEQAFGAADDLAKAHSIYTTIIDLDENIRYTNSPFINTENPLILQEALNMDAFYLSDKSGVVKISQPLYDQGKISGFVIFETEYQKNSAITSRIWVYGSISLVLIIAVVVLLGLSLFDRKKDRLLDIEEGLMCIAKGSVVPIKVKENCEYPHIYHAYNLLAEELKYVMAQRSYSQAQRKSFLTTISHELKTPISTISAYVEGLKNGIADDEEKKALYIDIIHTKMQMLSKLVDDFFSYTQEDESKFKYNFEECYADVFFERVFLDITSQNDDPTTYHNLLPKCIVNLDKFRIEQVILNLYNNAKKHTRDAQNITLSAYREGDDVVIEVSDNGEGIAPEDLPYIFDYYYQGVASKSKDYQGAGLGLAISKQIIDAHHGKIRVKSALGQGTSMFVHIPIS